MAMAIAGTQEDPEKKPGTDIETLEGALIDWINTCCPDADVEDVLQLYAPDVDPSAAGSAKLLHGCLSDYFGDRISLPRLAGNMHNGAFCKPKLLRSLTEAVLLAAVEGPKKEDAVQAIMNLDEAKQMVLGNALQRLMAHSEAAGRMEQSLPEMGESNPPTPRTPGEIPEYKSSADVLQDEIQEMRHQCKSEMVAIDSLENSEKALQAQLRVIMVDFAAEEEQAAETTLLIQKWQRNYGDEMRQRKAECNDLQQELHKEAENAKDLPQQQAKLQLQLDQELHACCEIQDNTEYLDVELREAAQSDQKDDLSMVKAETMACQMQQNVVDRKLRRAEVDEKEQMLLAKNLWEKLHMTEVAASAHENTFRQVRRVAEKEEETEADVLGLLEFRECEMRQLELSLGESGTAGAQIGDGRASMVGPGPDLLHSAPDMAELRSLLKELGQIARKHSSAQSELSQQQQRTRDLAHRLQQLEDESAQHQSSEVAAMAEFRTRREEELHYSSELREKGSLVQSEVRHAKLEKSEMEGAKQTDQEVAEMQTRLAALRVQATTKHKEEKEAAAKLAKMKEAILSSEAALSKLKQKSALVQSEMEGAKQADQEVAEMQARLTILHSQAASKRKENDEASAKLAEVQQDETQAARKLSEMQQGENEAFARLFEMREASAKLLIQEQHAKLEQSEMEGAKKKGDNVAEMPIGFAVSQATGKQKASEQSKDLHAKLKKTEMGVKPVDPEVAELQARLSVLQRQATSQRKEENEAATKLSDTLQAISKAEVGQASAAKLQEQPKQPRASPQAAKETQNEDIDGADAHAKGNKAVLKKLRQQLAEEERKLRQFDMNQSERKQSMHLETQLISDSIREIGTRCQMLVDKHRALLDDRKRLESEA